MPSPRAPRAKKKKPEHGLGPHDYESFDKLIDALNEEVAMVTVQGRAMFIRVPEFKRGVLNLYRQSDVRAWLANHRWLYGSVTQPKMKPAFDVWLQSDQANRFEGLVFDPAESPVVERDGGYYLNTFAGLGHGLDLDGPGGSYSLFRELVDELMCRGEESLSTFVWDWLAQLLQEPERKPGVALLIRGAKGTGKTTFADAAARLVGERYSPVVDSVEGFVGRFSGHLEQALLIRVEEGYHAGNPAHESRLKTLITAGRLPIERKGLDAYTVDHYARVIVTSNADHLVPTGGGERRFCVLDILPTRKQDGAFFAALWKQLDDGGFAELYRDLMARNISGRDWSKPPMTEGLADQIRLSLKPDEAWWADLLTSGAVAFTRAPELVQDEALDWPWDASWMVERTALYESFRQFAPGYRSPPSPALLGRFLQQVCPGIGERRVGPQGSRIRCYVLPPRGEALRAFEAARPGLSLVREATQRLKQETSRLDQPGEIGDVVAFPIPAAHPRRAA